MPERKTGVYAKLDDASLLPLVKQTNKDLERNYGRSLDMTNKLLDRLYQIIFSSLEHGNKAALLDAAESLKFAYGLAYGSKKVRSDEFLYWREIVLAALSRGEFQAAEYLLESARNLFRMFEKSRGDIADTLKLVADMAMRENRFFIGATIVNILMYWIPKLDEENKKVAGQLIGCLSTIGVNALKSGEDAFFREICVLLCKNVDSVNAEQEPYWNRLIIHWLNFSLKNGSKDNMKVWSEFFDVYKKLRPGIDNTFYNELVTILTLFAGKADDLILQEYLGKIFKCSFLYAGHAESISAAGALCEGYKNTVSVYGWHKGVSVYRSLFLAAFYITGRKDKKDRHTALRDAVLNIFVTSLGQSAALAALGMGYFNSLKVYSLWRETFLFMSKSLSSKRRIKTFWRLLADDWKRQHPYRAADNQELLMSFYD